MLLLSSCLTRPRCVRLLLMLSLSRAEHHPKRPDSRTPKRDVRGDKANLFCRLMLASFTLVSHANPLAKPYIRVGKPVASRLKNGSFAVISKTCKLVVSCSPRTSLPPFLTKNLVRDGACSLTSVIVCGRIANSGVIAPHASSKTHEKSCRGFKETC